MKKLLQVGLVALSTAMIAVPALAAPQEHTHQNTHNNAHGTTHAGNQHSTHPAVNYGQQHSQQRQQEMVQNRVLKPARDWKPGQALPSRYYGQGYKIDHKRYKHLSKPGKNQHWIKVNGDYILINSTNHSIVRIVAG